VYLKPEYLPTGTVCGGSERGNRISDANFLTAFHSNYGSILLSFRNMTTGRTTDGRRTDIGKHRISGSEGGPAIASSACTEMKSVLCVSYIDNRFAVCNSTSYRSNLGLIPGRPLSSQCEIPWQFHDISLTVRGPPAHVKCSSFHACTSVIVSVGGRNATVHDPKPKWTAQTPQSQEWTQICS